MERRCRYLRDYDKKKRKALGEESVSPKGGSNPRTPEYEAGVLPTTMYIVILYQFIQACHKNNHVAMFWPTKHENCKLGFPCGKSAGWQACCLS